MSAIEIFLILCLGHLASDFLLQTDAMVKAKKHGSAAYWKHGLIHYVAIVVVTLFADPALLVRIRFQAICVALIGAHLLIDFCKERLTAAAKIRDNALAFLADQAAHIVTIVAAALLVTDTSPVAAVVRFPALVPQRDRILAVLVIYFAVVFAGGYAIRYLTRPLTRHLPQLGDESALSFAQRGNVYRMARAKPGADGDDFALACDGGAGTCGEVHRAIPGAREIGALRGIFSYWHAAEFARGDFWRDRAAESPHRPRYAGAIIFSWGTAFRGRRTNLARLGHSSRCKRRSKLQNIQARCVLSCAGVLVARSGTACRAPTVGEKQRQKTSAGGQRYENKAEKNDVVLRGKHWRDAPRFYLRHRQECLCYWKRASRAASAVRSQSRARRFSRCVIAAR
jgi:hypothetical protein